MADKTDEENIDNPLNTQSDNPMKKTGRCTSHFFLVHPVLIITIQMWVITLIMFRLL
ncbi:MAG: hypothetical protein ACMG51_00650 [Ginsengibacter sp.]